MWRRILLGMVAGGVYVWSIGVALSFFSRMRDLAAGQFSTRPMVFGVLALLGAGVVTALVVVHGRRLPTSLWTAGILSFVLIPQWAFVPWFPAPVGRWVLAGPFDLQTTSLLAGLMLGLAVHATWFDETTASAPTATDPARPVDR